MIKELKIVFLSFFPPLLAALLGSKVVSENLDWYYQLNSPKFTPSAATIGLIWTALYLLMGVACYISFKTKRSSIKNHGYISYFIQIVFNFSWTAMFFGLRDVALGFVVSVLLVLAVFVNLVRFYQTRRKSALVLLPYFVWVCFACYLNYQFAVIN